MELRQLKAFVAVATELHFGRAAEKLHLAQPTLTELIQRLERDLGTALFTRTTRRVALTGAGSELLGHATAILAAVATAAAAVGRVAQGDAGTVRVGVTPPVAHVLAKHLRASFGLQAPGVTVDVQPMWLPTLAEALTAGQVDVAITCGLVDVPDGVVGEVFCAEPILIGLRHDHRLADRERLTLADLERDVLGRTSGALFPAWARAQDQALAASGVCPASVELEATDVTAANWVDQPEIDWILLIGSLTGTHTRTLIKAVDPPQLVPFTLQWRPDRAPSPAVERFVHHSLTSPPPPGWHTQPGHRDHHADRRGQRS